MYESADHEVLSHAIDWLGEGAPVTLVTVGRTWGSAPRPVGSLLAMHPDGRLCGSVSGGCVEDDLLERLRVGELALDAPTVIDYGVNREETQRFGLPCGGRLELVVESVREASSLKALLQAVESRRLVMRRVNVATGAVSLQSATVDDAFSYDGRELQKVFGPVWRLLVIGAGQLARYVSQLALTLDYHVIVCDPREQYARSWQVEGVELDTRSPDDAVCALANDARSAVVALSHDPKLDDLALMEALNAEVFYVGALGSAANNAKRRERLASLGVPAQRLAQLRGPIGLAIGSRTPPEIAVSILAEITAQRHGMLAALTPGETLRDVPARRVHA